MISMYWLLCLAVLWTSEVIATQIDLEVPYHELSKQTYTIPKKYALFGYSIAYQKTINSLIVGSPLENDMGQVYLCPIKENDDKCTKARIPPSDFKSDNAKEINHTWWLGARVDAGDSFYIACAPRFVNDLHTNGRCYYKDTSTTEPKDLIPMQKLTKEQKTKYHEAAFQVSPNDFKKGEELWTDTFGLSSFVHKSRVFIGGPVMSIGQTQLYNQVMDPPTLISVNNKYLKENNDNRNVAFNFGYSITSGYFIKSDDDIAISTTYGTIGYGRIYFYTYNGTLYEANDVWADGEEVANVGSLFGASLATLSLIGDRSVLIVGAPAYATSGYDIGAVFIYKFIYDSETFDVESKLFKKLLVGNVEKSGSRFGASIATVGDFDGDKIDEVAIAAPFENEGSGVVYLYSGKELVDNTHSKVPFMQRLLPEENPNKAQFFGLSLTALKDADENGCNELAIGAPGVSSVTLLRCMASVNVSFDAPFPDLTVQAKILNLTDTTFTYSPCLVVQPYEKPDPRTVETEVNFSIQVIHPDVKILDSKNDTKTFIKKLRNVGSTACETLSILLPQKADYDRDILFNISVNLLKNPLVEREFNPRLVLLNKGIGYSKLFKVPALPGSNLTFQTYTTFNESHEYMIGSSESENLTISMWNAGNTAHGACVRTRLNGVTITHLPDHRICNFSNGELVCAKEILTRGDHLEVHVALSTKTLTSSQDRINISSTLFTSRCKKSTGQTKNITVKLTRDSKFSIKKFSIPRLNVNITEQDFVKGKNIDHIYEITNKGITVWTNVSCQVALPPQVTVRKVTVQTTPPVNCKVQKHVAHCNITELSKNIPINIKIQMKIEPNSPFVDLIKKGKATVDTELSLTLKDTKPEKITTILTLWEAPKVPLWMIVVASLFALLIVVIIIWVLHECGCLQRAKKQELQELKKDVKRQSMRKSMMLRQSTIEVIPNKGDRERLLNVPEEDVGSQDGELRDHEHRNEKPVKEIHIDDNDPARVAFNAELAKTLAKGGQKVVTEAEVY